MKNLFAIPILMTFVGIALIAPAGAQQRKCLNGEAVVFTEDAGLDAPFAARRSAQGWEIRYNPKSTLSPHSQRFLEQRECVRIELGMVESKGEVEEYKHRNADCQTIEVLVGSLDAADDDEREDKVEDLLEAIEDDWGLAAASWPKSMGPRSRRLDLEDCL